MGEIVNLLNAAGGAFVAFAVPMLVQSSLLIVILTLLDLVLRKRVRAVVRYWIWLLVLAKLILPPSFYSPTGVAYWVGGQLPTLTAPVESIDQEPPVPPADRTVASSAPWDPEFAPSMGHAFEEAAMAPTRAAPPTVPHGPSITWPALALLGWAILVLVMAVLLIQRTLFVHRLVAQSHEPPREIIELLRQCAFRMGVRTHLAVKLSPLSASPSVCDLRRPVILIPEEMLVQLQVHELRSVLFHELAHVKRGDLWLNLLQALLQVVYFYHPLLWAANVRIRRVREQAVDETVLAAMGDAAEDYPRTLLSVSRLAFGPPTLSLRLLGVVESQKALTGRIRYIVSRPFPKSAKPGCAGCVLVAIIALTLLPMARAASRTPPARARVAPTVYAVETAPTPRELLDRYRKAVTGWDKSVSMRIECDHSMAYQGRDFRHWKYDVTHRRDGDRWESFGRCQFEGKLDGDPYSFNEEFRDLVLNDYYLRYSQRDSGSEREAFVVTDVREMLLNLQAQSAHGGFLEGLTGGIGSATHQAEAMCDSNDVRYVGQETLGSTSCHVVEAKTEYGTFTVWLAPQKGYNALKSVWRKSGRDILREKIRIEDQGITEWTETVDAVDVQEIDGVFLPVAGRLTGKTKWASGEESEDHVVVQRRDIVLHPDFQALGAFQIVLPEGTEVRLTGNAQRTFRWSQGGFTPDINKYLMRSLLGKPLPALDAFRMDLDPAGIEGKMLVICFFDMQQRPSRNCMEQLAKKTELLVRKGMVILGIQAAQVEEDRLREWLRENNTHVPVGMVQADEEQTRCAWGVRSLPWLIQTDEQHIVRAEGFALSGLDGRIEAVRNPSGAQAAPAGTVPEGDRVAEQRSATCLVKGSQGRVLAQERFFVAPMGTEYQTDAEGMLSIHYAPPADPRGLLVYVRHKEPDLIGATWLPQAGGEAEVELVPAVSVQGRVLDPNGGPLAGVQVAALPMSSQFVLTDSAGTFDIAWAKEWEPGENLCLMARYMESNLAALADIGRETKVIEIKLEPALTLTGVVEDEDGHPLSEAKVGLSLKRSWRCWTPVEPVTTDSAGRYAFRTLPQNQEYVIFARAPGYWEDGISTGLIYGKQGVADPGRIILRKPILSVSGVVVDDNGKPVAGIEVGTRGNDQPDCRTQTDTQGKFTLQGMCRGHAEIAAKLGRALYGTIETQAGRQDVRLIVRPIP